MNCLSQGDNGNFTMIDNYVIRSRDISLTALGMFVKLRSLPDGWKFTEKGLESICKNGIRTVKSSLRELEELGLLFRFQLKNNGRYGNKIYHITNNPMTEEEKRIIVGRYNPQASFVQVPDNTEFLPMLQNALSESALSQNDTQYNTNIYNTNIYKENNIKEKIGSSQVDFASKTELRSETETETNGFFTRECENSICSIAIEEKLTNDFNAIIQDYPRKLGKTIAFKRYKEWLKGRVVAGKKVKLSNYEMFDAVQNYILEIERRKTEKQYIKHLSTLFGDCLLDYLNAEEE